MNNVFYSKQQWKVFASDLFEAFVKLGFEVVENPYVDHNLDGFRATYIRRYFLQNSTPFFDESLMTLVHVVGLPFGSHSQKMVILASPKNMENELVCKTIKLRLFIDDEGSLHVINSDQTSQSGGSHKHEYQDIASQTPSSSSFELYPLEQCIDAESLNNLSDNMKLAKDLANYVSHIIEMISPGLIRLPIEMKLEILKRLSIGSIIRMSQVNSEFRSLIFQHGESLWKYLCLRDFNIRSIDRNRHSTWADLYKEAYIIQQIDICRKERALPGLPDRPALPPAPNRLQIGWLPEWVDIPFYPLVEDMHPIGDRLQLVLQLPPLRRAESLDSVL